MDPQPRLPSESAPEIRHLGRIGYQDALKIQEEAVEKRLAGESGDIVFLLEHDPVYTIGRTPDQSSLGADKTLPHPVVVTNRGGQATYHGPGQLVGYPIIDLRPLGQDLHRYLRALELSVIELCRCFGVAASRKESLTGAWVDSRKVASIGVGVRKWITMHGFALNVMDDLSGFSAITPCGIGGVEMTSLVKESPQPISFEAVAEKAGEILCRLPDMIAADFPPSNK